MRQKKSHSCNRTIFPEEPMTEKVIIEVKHVRKVYQTVRALDDISLTVLENEIFGIVGPNGAGKTTLIECIAGLRKPDDGCIRVKGMDPIKQGYELRAHIGIQLQDSSLQDRLKVWEALDLYGAFYSRTVDKKVLLEQLGLAEHRNRPFAKLSGGQKQRLFVALALINDPGIVFLDELTTGLDPQARHAVWDLVCSIRSQGKTIFLTTHFMEEAEGLCDRVAIIDHGRIAALDTPGNLVKTIKAENRITFTVKGHLPSVPLEGINGVNRVETRGQRFIVYGHGDGLVKELVNFLAEKGIEFSDLNVRPPNLEDVFLTLTGREMRD
jgi:ABC-2 type transport system ATP-binding protein